MSENLIVELISMTISDFNKLMPARTKRITFILHAAENTRFSIVEESKASANSDFRKYFTDDDVVMSDVANTLHPYPNSEL